MEEKIPVVTSEQIEAWRKESPDGKVYEICQGDETYYFISPTRPKFKRFADNALKSSFDAMSMLLADCIKYPDAQTLMARVEKTPALVSVLAGALTQSLGLAGEASVKNV